MKKTGWIAISSLFVIIGIAVMIFGVKEYLSAKYSETWPNVKGIVLSSEIKSHLSNDSRTTYSAEINYEYSIDNETISNNQIKFGYLSTSDRSDASEYTNKYPKNKDVTVFYNSSDPYESVLEPGVHTSTYFMPIFGLVFALFGSVFVVIGLFSKKLN